MKIDEKILKRFNELIDKGEKVLSSAIFPKSDFVFSTHPIKVNHILSGEWALGCLNLLSRIFGKDSIYFSTFNELISSIHLLNEAKKAQGF